MSVELSPLALSPLALSLVAASLFAVGIQFSRKGLNHGDYKAGTWLNILSASFAFWLFAPFGLPPSQWSWPAFWIFVGIGFAMPLISSHCAFAATKILGPTISATVSGVSPLFSAVFAVVVLGEVMTVGVGLGTVAIVCGVVVLSWQGKAKVDWPLWALVLPIAAALIRALAQGFTKIGFEEIPSPYFAALVGYTVSAILASLLYLSRGERFPPLIRRPGLNWFVVGGFINACAIAVLYVALRNGELVVVGPGVSTYPVFTLLLSALIFRQEPIGWRKIIGVALVVPGVALIAARSI